MDSDSDTEPQIFQHPPHPSLPLTLTTPETYDCQLLVIAQEGTAALFAHSLIGPLKPSNRLNFSKSKQGSLADLYLDS